MSFLTLLVRSGEAIECLRRSCAAGLIGRLRHGSTLPSRRPGSRVRVQRQDQPQRRRPPRGRGSGDAGSTMDRRSRATTHAPAGGRAILQREVEVRRKVSRSPRAVRLRTAVTAHRSDPDRRVSQPTAESRARCGRSARRPEYRRRGLLTVRDLITESYAVRITDAVTSKAQPRVRTHDGHGLAGPMPSEET